MNYFWCYLYKLLSPVDSNVLVGFCHATDTWFSADFTATCICIWRSLLNKWLKKYEATWTKCYAWCYGQRYHFRLLVQCTTKENSSPEWNNLSRCFWNTKKPVYINPYSVNRLKCASCADLPVLVQLIINIYQCLFWLFQLFVHWRFHCLKYKPYNDLKRKIHSCNLISFKKSGSQMVYLCAACFLLKVVDIRKEFEVSCRNLA